ncbi:UNVERIFIED_CONTAM: hypothetical protein NCL1_44163 [Trichonephila clavipes]
MKTVCTDINIKNIGSFICARKNMSSNCQKNPSQDEDKYSLNSRLLVVVIVFKLISFIFLLLQYSFIDNAMFEDSESECREFDSSPKVLPDTMQRCHYS